MPDSDDDDDMEFHSEQRIGVFTEAGLGPDPAIDVVVDDDGDDDVPLPCRRSIVYETTQMLGGATRGDYLPRDEALVAYVAAYLDIAYDAMRDTTEKLMASLVAAAPTATAETAAVDAVVATTSAAKVTRWAAGAMTAARAEVLEVTWC